VLAARASNESPGGRKRKQNAFSLSWFRGAVFVVLIAATFVALQ